MRFTAALLCWLVATAMLAVAVPAMWAQRNLIDVDGYAALAQRAAGDPELQAAAAADLTTQAVRLIRGRGYNVDRAMVRDVATAYTAGPSFPAQFAEANRGIHESVFTGTGTGSENVDLSPMLNDSAFADFLGDYQVQVPDEVTVPVAGDAPDVVQPGQLRPLATWGPWVSSGAAVAAGIFALLTLIVARRRGKALTALGVSALLVGAGGWATVEVVRRYFDDALDRAAGDMRRIAGVMANFAVASLHQWLNMTLLAGGVLVVAGVIVAMLGGLRKS